MRGSLAPSHPVTCEVGAFTAPIFHMGKLSQRVSYPRTETVQPRAHTGPALQHHALNHCALLPSPRASSALLPPSAGPALPIQTSLCPDPRKRPPRCLPRANWLISQDDPKEGCCKPILHWGKLGSGKLPKARQPARGRRRDRSSGQWPGLSLARHPSPPVKPSLDKKVGAGMGRGGEGPRPTPCRPQGHL